MSAQAAKKPKVPKPAPTASAAWRKAAAEAIPHTLATVNVAELSAVLSLMAIAGQSHEGMAQWQTLVTFAPWYAQATGRTLDQVYALPVDMYTVGVKDRLSELQARVPSAVDGLGRIATLLGAG